MVFLESEVRLNSLWFFKLFSSPNATSSLNIGFLPHPVFLVVFCLCLLILETLVGDICSRVLFYRKMAVKFLLKIDFMLLSFLVLYQTAFCFSSGMRTT